MKLVAIRDEAVRTSKEDWLKHALRALIDHGIDQVKVQVIARELNVPIKKPAEERPVP